MARILIAPDSFKGSATSRQVCDALARGWLEKRNSDEIECAPFADGGEGTLDCIESVLQGAVRIPIRVQGATGAEHNSSWLLVNGDTAVIEMAALCGITTVEKLDPLNAHSFGLGQGIRDALNDSRVNEILVAIGGSASTDGGIGALVALGFKVVDKAGNSVDLGGGSLHLIDSIIAPAELNLPSRGIKILVDVQSPLVGPEGAAYVFGPQKGADAKQVETLDHGLGHLLDLLSVTDQPGFGAAGGVAFGLSHFLGGTIVSGVEMIADVIGLEEKIKKADCVITGEGSFDSQSFSGKAVGYMIERSAHFERPLLIACGVNKNLEKKNTYSLVDIAPDRDSAMKESQHWLFQLGRQMALDWED